MPAVSKDMVSEFQLLVGERSLEPFAKQLGKPDDRMQGCSKLMGHARKEFALELVRRFHFPVPEF